MSNALPFIGSASTVLGTVANPATIQSSDGSVLPLSMDHNGGSLVRELGGKRYAAASRGNVFMATANASTGRTILAPGGTTSGFMFYNPVGSGVNMEIIQILVAPLTATDVVGVLGLEYGAPPTTVANAVTPVAQPIGLTRGAALCKASYGSTIVAMTYLMHLPVAINTTGGVAYDGSWLWDADGMLVIAPGGAVNIVSSTTQSTNLWAQHVVWAEWLP